MRALSYAAFGDPAAVLNLADPPLPEPGPGQARIRTILSPIHNHDYFTVQGTYGYKPPLPAIGGSEAVGIIDALGPDTPGVIGARVATGAGQGAWAEYFLAPVKALVPVPAEMRDEDAAQWMSMPMSAAMLLKDMEAEAGQWLIQNAATGAVAKVLAPLAAARGLNVVNLVRRSASVAELEALGVTHVLATDVEGWRKRALELTGGEGFHLAVDSVGGQESGELLKLLRVAGALWTFGAMSGKPMQLDAGTLIFKEAAVRGFWGAKVGARLTPQARVEMADELARLIVSGAVKLPLEGVFSLSRAGEAIVAHLRAGRIGKVAFRP